MSKEAKQPPPPNSGTLKLRNSNSLGVSSGSSLGILSQSNFYDAESTREVTDTGRFSGKSIKDLITADDPTIYRVPRNSKESMQKWMDQYVNKIPNSAFNQQTPMTNVRTIIANEVGSIHETFDASATDEVITQRASELAGKYKEPVIIFKAVTKISPKYEVTVEAL